MINQVDFEGYLTRAWEYREQRFMRLANHRPHEDWQAASDYITVLIDSALLGMAPSQAVFCTTDG